MKSKLIRSILKAKIKIELPYLILLGPIRTFFARISNYIEKNNVFYIHDYLLSKIFKQNKWRKKFLINSNVSYKIFYLSRIVKVLGKSPDDINERNHQNKLGSFFTNHEKIYILLFSKFFKYIFENSQIKVIFYGSFPFYDIFIF